MLAAASLIAVLACGCATAAGTHPLVSYDRTGGLAGFDEHLVVKRDGGIRLQGRTRTLHGRLDDATRRHLTSTLKRAGLSQLNSQYDANSSVRDAIGYRVTYQGRAVNAMDTAIPDKLRPVLRELDQIISMLRPGP